MELGALLCTPKKPACFSCPLKAYCRAFQEESVEKFPQKIPKKAKKKRFFHYIVLKKGPHIYLKKREKSDIWKGLYEFFLYEYKEESRTFSLPDSFKKLFCGTKIPLISLPEASIDHHLTHQKLAISFSLITLDCVDLLAFDHFLLAENLRPIPIEKVFHLPFPIVLSNFFHRFASFFSID